MRSRPPVRRLALGPLYSDVRVQQRVRERMGRLSSIEDLNRNEKDYVIEIVCCLSSRMLTDIQ